MNFLCKILLISSCLISIDGFLIAAAAAETKRAAESALPHSAAKVESKVKAEEWRDMISIKAHARALATDHAKDHFYYLEDAQIRRWDCAHNRITNFPLPRFDKTQTISSWMTDGGNLLTLLAYGDYRAINHVLLLHDSLNPENPPLMTRLTLPPDRNSARSSQTLGIHDTLAIGFDDGVHLFPKPWQTSTQLTIPSATPGSFMDNLQFIDPSHLAVTFMQYGEDTHVRRVTIFKLDGATQTPVGSFEFNARIHESLPCPITKSFYINANDGKLTRYDFSGKKVAEYIHGVKPWSNAHIDQHGFIIHDESDVEIHRFDPPHVQRISKDHFGMTRIGNIFPLSSSKILINGRWNPHPPSEGCISDLPDSQQIKGIWNRDNNSWRVLAKHKTQGCANSEESSIRSGVVSIDRATHDPLDSDFNLITFCRRTSRAKRARAPKISAAAALAITTKKAQVRLAAGTGAASAPAVLGLEAQPSAAAAATAHALLTTMPKV